MSKSKQTLVSAATLRAFYQANVEVAEKVATEAGVTTNSVLGAEGNAKNIRGRVNPAFIADFAERTGQTYLEVPKGGTSGERTVTIERIGKNGRALKPVEVPLSEARVLSGTVGRKGILSKADRAKVAEALAAK